MDTGKQVFLAKITYKTVFKGWAQSIRTITGCMCMRNYGYSADLSYSRKGSPASSAAGKP